MKKSFIAVIISAALYFACLGGLTACDGFGIMIKDVSSLDELNTYYAADQYSVRLTCDIDGGNAEVEPFKTGAKFDGQGHTIKNLTVKKDSSGWFSSLFSTQVREIRNINLENITVKGSGVSDAIVLAASCWDSGAPLDCIIENVHIKNCTLTAKQSIADARFSVFAGGIYGGGSYDSYSGKTENEPDKCTIKNCTVRDTTIKLTEYTGSKVNNVDLFVGGIAGSCNTVTGCKVIKSTVSAESSEMSCVPFVGGIVGSTIGSVEACAAENNMLTARAKYYGEDKWFHKDTTSKVYIGGVVGRFSAVRTDGEKANGCGTLSLSYADGNSINAYSSGSAWMGGFAGYVGGGTVERCYAKTNEMIADGCKSGNKDDSVQRRLGGFGGAIGTSTVKSCFAYNDKALYEYTFPDISKSSKAAGFVAGINDATVITNCASYVSELNAPIKDEFCPTKVDGISSCCVSGDASGNVCGLEVADESFWESPNALKTKLNLTVGPWKFDKGVPYLEI